MINFEKFLFKKIPVWIYILTLILGLIFLSLFGSVVRHVAKGGNLTGQIGIVAESIAKFPGKFMDNIAPLHFFETPPEGRGDT